MSPPQLPTTVKTVLNLISNNLRSFVGKVVTIRARLSLQDQTPLPDKKVDFYADQYIGSDFTDSEGIAEVNWNTSGTVPDTHIILANYSGDAEHEFSSAEINILLENKSLGVEVALPPVARQHVLAKVFNEQNLDFDRGYAQEYLALRHNFSDIPYKELSEREDFTLTMKNKPHDVDGFNINNSLFAVHVVYCDGFAGFCKFRINGVLTPQLYFPEKLEADKTGTFDLDGKYVLKVKSAQFELCDNHRFCHLGYEGYDKVEVAIERKIR